MIVSCNTKGNKLMVDVYETSASGNKLTKVSGFTPEKNSSIINRINKRIKSRNRRT